MSDSDYSQKKIMKNAVMLYIRMAVIMLVTLYTSRVILHALGVIDYGIYNLVGSVVISLSFVSNSLMSSTQRFLSFELGRKNGIGVRKVFNTSIFIHIVLVVAVVILLESIGLWFLNSVLVIPEERRSAANIAYQLSILTFVFNFLRIPYNAIIIAHERMGVFAFFSVGEAILKLIIVFVLMYSNYDHLVLYCILFASITFIINTAYMVYCHLVFKSDCYLSFVKDKSLTREMVGFSGWNLFGGFTGMATNEGPGYFMNYFIGVQMNAAMGIAKQVGNAVYSFASSFQTAFNPQIVKLYSSEEKEKLYSLVIRSSKVSFALIFIMALPITLCAPTIFKLWLVDVPDYSIIFSVLLLFSQLIAAWGSPLWMLAHAAGNIKKYQVVISMINLLILPASWIILQFGYEPYWILVLLVVLNVLILVFRISYLNKRINFPEKDFYSKVILTSLVVALAATIVPLFLRSIVSGLGGDIIVVISSIMSVAVSFYLIGLEKSEKALVVNWIKSRLLERK